MNKVPPLKKYNITVDSKLDIFNGNLTSFTTMLPARYRNVQAIQLMNVAVPGIANNVYYEYLSIEPFNQLSNPTAGVDFAFAKIPLPGGPGTVIFSETNGYNFGPVILDNPIATLDRLHVSFVDGRGNLVPQPNSCVFQIQISTGGLTPYGGGSTITPSGRFLGGTY